MTGQKPYTGIEKHLNRAGIMNTLLQDLRYSVRLHLKSPGLTTLAVLTLALGIGACTAVFSVVDAILLRPLPYTESDKIVIPWRLAPKEVDPIPWGPNEFRLFSKESKTFQDLGAFMSQPFTMTGVEEAKLLEGLRVSSGFFSVLGVSPIVGRTFTAQEDRPGYEHEVILSYQLWQDQFGADQHLLGLPMNLNGETYTIIGVMPADFTFPHANEMPGAFSFPREAQLWVPLALPATSTAGDPGNLAVVGRLKPGFSIKEVQGEMDVFAKREESEHPKNKGWFNARVTSLSVQVVGDRRLPLLLMLGAVGTVLLIACSNVASLLLARSLARRKEFTLRAALGAGQLRLVQQVLTENLLLALAGGVVGVLLGEAGIYLVRIFGPANIPRLQETRLDLKVFVFAFAVSIIAGIFLGLFPAVSAIRKNLAEALKEGGQRSGGSPAAPRIRKILIVAQVALALVLVIASGLVTKTFFRLLRVDGGFHAGNVLTFEVSLSGTKYNDDHHIVVVYDKLLQQLRAVSGVQSAGIVQFVPMAGSPDGTAILFPGRTIPAENEAPIVSYTIVSPGYFTAIGASLLRGRDFLESDKSDSMPVTVINNAMAKKFWPTEDPIGKQVGTANTKYPAMTIIGIVADVKHLSFREQSAPEMYVTYTQKPWPSMLRMQVAVRTQADPTAIMGSLRTAIHPVDPDLPVAKVAPLTTLADNSMAEPRFAMLLLGAFGILALVLASVGMYGVISYSVSQRTQEIGIRLAIGAPRRAIFSMVVWQGARLACIGVVIGFLFALALTQLMGSLLYNVRPTDPFVYGAAVSVLLLCVAVLACYVPARRAMRVDPGITLRDQ